MPTPFSISDGNQVAEVDKTANGLVVTLSEHHEMHEGHAYRAYVTANVGSGNTLSLAITTPGVTQALPHAV